jgi:hypothetical protein
MTSRNLLTNSSVLSHEERSDENLINAIATGNEAAMRTLYARHHVRIYHFIVRLGCDRAGRGNLDRTISGVSA